MLHHCPHFTGEKLRSSKGKWLARALHLVSRAKIHPQVRPTWPLLVDGSSSPGGHSGVSMGAGTGIGRPVFLDGVCSASSHCWPGVDLVLPAKFPNQGRHIHSAQQ